MHTPTGLHHRILALLDGAGVSYEKLAHGHVHTSADAAAIRGTRLEEAAKGASS